MSVVAAASPSRRGVASHRIAVSVEKGKHGCHKGDRSDYNDDYDGDVLVF